MKTYYSFELETKQDKKLFRRSTLWPREQEAQSEHHVRRELKIAGLHCLTWCCTLCAQEQMCSFVKRWLVTALCTSTEGQRAPEPCQCEAQFMGQLWEQSGASPHVSRHHTPLAWEWVGHSELTPPQLSWASCPWHCSCSCSQASFPASYRLTCRSKQKAQALRSHQTPPHNFPC